MAPEVRTPCDQPAVAHTVTSASIFVALNDGARSGKAILWCERTMRAAVIDPGGGVPEIINFLELMDLTAEVALVRLWQLWHGRAADPGDGAAGNGPEGVHGS